MRLEGSCQCGAVRFQLESPHPYPYQRCYCSICRKTQGGGGYAINLGGDNASLRVQGRQHVTVYHARLKNPEDARAHRSPAERHFCGTCGTQIMVQSDALGVASVNAMTFDDPSAFRPEIAYFGDSAPKWCEVDQRLTAFGDAE